MDVDNTMNDTVMKIDIDDGNDDKVASSTGTTVDGYEHKNEMDDITPIPTNIVDINKLTTLLEGSTKNDYLIANKHVMALIGLTGAGKTTSTLYLAGAKFEEEEVEGYVHYKPIEIPNESLSEFAVSGGATSVTTTLQATPITLKDENGQKELITVCGTPGFGDTKGIEMEISNGHGIIATLKKATSIKPVIVIDYSGMHTSRFYSLRKNLSTVIAMLGRKSIDFSPFSYIFTRCEGKNKKRISNQLAGFQKGMRNDPHVEDKEILDALLTDMILKTTSGSAICIDPEEHDEAQDTLMRVWKGSRIENPASTFVNFCSKESMLALLSQVNIEMLNLESSLKKTELDSVEVQLHRMTKLRTTLSLPEVDNAVEQGIMKTRGFFDTVLSGIERLVSRANTEFEDVMSVLPSKLHLVSRFSDIAAICGMHNFDCDIFISDITEKFFSIVTKSVSYMDKSTTGSVDNLKQCIVRYSLLDKELQSLMTESSKKLYHSRIISAIESELNSVLKVLDESLRQEDPTTFVLNKNLTDLDFAIESKTYFCSEELHATALTSVEFSWFTNRINNIMDCINEKTQTIVTYLKNLDNTMHEELLGENEWSFSSISKLNNVIEFKEARKFLQAVLGSRSLVIFCQRSTQNFEVVISDFDDYVTKYLQGVVYFLQCQSQDVSDNEATDIATRVEKANAIISSSDTLLEIVATLCDLDVSTFREISDKLTCEKGKMQQFIADSKKIAARHSIRRGKLLEPTEEELSKANNKRALRELLWWYERCNDLKSYWKKHGHCNVRQRDPKLGFWVHQQREDKKKYEAGAKTTMTDEKLQCLADMDFQWIVLDRKALWNQRFEELEQFKEEHGHCRVPRKTSKLGDWVKEQRKTKYRASNSKEKVAKLRKIGVYE